MISHRQDHDDDDMLRVRWHHLAFLQFMVLTSYFDLYVFRQKYNSWFKTPRFPRLPRLRYSQDSQDSEPPKLWDSIFTGPRCLWGPVNGSRCLFVTTYIQELWSRWGESVWQHVFWTLQQEISDSEISCKNGCNAFKRRCFTCVPVSGLLPDAGWQVHPLLLLLESWAQLLLRGHQGEGSFVFCKEEEEADSINLETKCEEERRVFAEKTCFNYTSLKTSF